MSDDFEDLADDDLFTNPASLAAIEQAVVSAEQNARTQGNANVNSTNRKPPQVNGATGVGGGMGMRKPDGKYHHSVTLAGSSNLRGRGGAFPSCLAFVALCQLLTYASLAPVRPPSTILSHQNAGKTVSNVQGMGMRPRPMGASTINGRVVSPAPPLPQPKPQPVLAQAFPIEEEEEYGPEISVDDFGNYFNSEVKDVRRDGLDESILQVGNKEKQELATTTGGLDTRGDTAVNRLGERKTLTRSTSVGTGSAMISSSAQNRPNPDTGNGYHPTSNMSRTNHSVTGNGNRGIPEASQSRTSAGHENARRQAIQRVLSASGSQTSRPSSSFQAAAPYVPGAGPQKGGDPQQSGRSREMSDHNSFGGAGRAVQSNAVRLAEERPSTSAGIGNEEVEVLKRQLAQLLKENKEKEEKTSRAMQDLWRYQGEAKNVRLKADEEKKHAEGRYTDLQKQLADLQEMLRVERVGHKRALDTVQTDHAFKVGSRILEISIRRRRLMLVLFFSKQMHNEQSSHIKLRIGTSQRNRNAVQQMQSTPSRPYRGTVNGSQQNLLHLQTEATSYDHTPSRSPTKKGGVAMGKKRLGSMGPPNVPDVAASFMTPARPLTASSKKARVLQEVKNKALTGGTDFKGLHDAFADSQTDTRKKRKTNGEMYETIAGSPTPSMFEQGEQDPPAWNAYDEIAPPLVDEVGQEDYEDVEEGDIITEVCHVIFTHFRTPLWETAEGPVKTVQRILTGHPDPSHVSYPLYQERCSLFLEACGNQEASPVDFCRDINESLWDLLSALLIDDQEKVDPATVVSIMHLLTMLRVRIPQFASVYSAAVVDMPKNMFEVLISQYWQQPDPAISVAKRGHAAVEDADPEERLTLSWAYQAEVGYAISSLIAGIQSVDGEAAPCYASFASSPDGIRALISPKSPIAVVFEALETLNVMSSTSVKPKLNLSLPDLAQDLLSELVGGNQREDDAIYAMYVLTKDEEMEGDDGIAEGANADEEDESDRMVIVIED
ncbi:hypothetical protein QFC22_005800 [Naganishia vaughanmartiniae]|uniref:Uncharacterized protein n=1 Tax=Naganishia vaughanmartiniae TaxID=1424756 RepID=A0ACC2WSH6_9TREE|nr:hypothetical protein QFC22_005800 [Naganishia vaughanmartiniae]